MTTTTTGSFRYLDPKTIHSSSDNSKPWAKVDTDATSYSQTTITKPVTDIRSLPPPELSPPFSHFTTSTDKTGFSLHRSPSLVPATAFQSNPPDQTTIYTQYYPEIESLLRKHLVLSSGPTNNNNNNNNNNPSSPPEENENKETKIHKILIFDHTIRKHDPSAPRQPVQSVHVDQTPRAAEARVRRHVSSREEADTLLRKRYQIVNVWRPIGHVASDFPLALVDWRTTDPRTDLVAVDLLYPLRREENGGAASSSSEKVGDGNGDGDDDGDDRGKEVLPDPEARADTKGYEVKGETYGVVPNEKHRFFYVKDMTPDEVLFIKCFDSWGQGMPAGKEGIANCTPHTAFIDPQTPPGAKGRESVEVRCLVFYD